jgi:hypothetical protein
MVKRAGCVNVDLQFVCYGVFLVSCCPWQMDRAAFVARRRVARYPHVIFGALLAGEANAQTAMKSARKKCAAFRNCCEA